MKLQLSSKSPMKTLLYILKYRPEVVEIKEDEKGWCSLQPILKALRIHHPEHKYITAFDIKHMAMSDVKKRVEVSKDLKSIKLIRGV